MSGNRGVVYLGASKVEVQKNDYSMSLLLAAQAMLQSLSAHLTYRPFISQEACRHE